MSFNFKKVSYLHRISNKTEHMAISKWRVLNKWAQLFVAETADCPQYPFFPSSY